jgi:hypothetical protein
MASRGANVADSIVCACLISGSFSMDLADWWRYRLTFQPLIVPKLVGELGDRYVTSGPVLPTYMLQYILILFLRDCVSFIGTDLN